MHVATLCPLQPFPVEYESRQAWRLSPLGSALYAFEARMVLVVCEPSILLGRGWDSSPSMGHESFPPVVVIVDDVRWFVE